MANDRIAYLGIPGSFSEEAAQSFKNTLRLPAAKLQGYSSFLEIFESLATSCEYGAIPIENTFGGTIHENYDLLLRFSGSVTILGELDLPVVHCLCAMHPETPLTDVLSHPQALAQCQQHLAARSLKGKPASSTAEAAVMLLKDPALGAICSKRAAEYYGLTVLEDNFQDSSQNFTRFLLLARKSGDHRVEDLTNCKTSLVFNLNNEPGSLAEGLTLFSRMGLDLCKIESRPSRIEDPSRTDKYDYLFYCEFEGHQKMVAAVEALNELRKQTNYVKVLGSFKKSGYLPEIRFQETPAKETPKPRVGLYGFGPFGQFLATLLADHYQLFASSRSAYVSDTVKILPNLEELVGQQLDILILCPAIVAFAEVLDQLQAFDLSKVLVVDVLSVKEFPKKVLLEKLGSSQRILCTHPMFGPKSGKNGLVGLNFMFERVQLPEDDQIAADFLKVFRDLGCTMVEMSCEDHDRLAASSQFLAHVLGRVFLKMGLEATAIDTKGYRSLLGLLTHTSFNSDALFQGLYAYNPFAPQRMEDLKRCLESVLSTLEPTD